MKQLFERLSRYGDGFTLMLRVREKKGITIVLTHVTKDNRVFEEEVMLSDKEVARWREGDESVIYVLDELHKRVMKRV